MIEKLTRLVLAMSGLVQTTDRCACALETKELEAELQRRGFAIVPKGTWTITQEDIREASELTGVDASTKIPWRTLANAARQWKSALEEIDRGIGAEANAGQEHKADATNLYFASRVVNFSRQQKWRMVKMEGTLETILRCAKLKPHDEAGMIPMVEEALSWKA